MSKEKDKKQKKDKPISLAGPDFKELMTAFLKVDPKEGAMAKNPCAQEQAEYEAASVALEKSEQEIASVQLPERKPGERFIEIPRELVENARTARERKLKARQALEDCEAKQSKD